MKSRLVLLASAIVLVAPLAQAQDQGDWIFRVGGHTVRPKSDNSTLVNVDAGTSLTFSATYLFAPQWGVELLAALPFEHDVDLNGGGKVADVKHLPPTLSLQYQFNHNGTVRPYVGAGLNYTLFFDESTTGTLSGNKLSLDDSFGLAAQAGIDIAFTNGWVATIDARYLDIDTDATLNASTDLGPVEIDPYTIGLSIGKRF
jgi:outer membrane protein